MSSTNLPPPGPTPVVAGVISKRFVQLLSTTTGRGPTRVRTYLHEDLVTVVLREVLTKAEQALTRHGHTAPVLEARRAIQGILRDGLIAIVEEETGRVVEAFLSSNQLNPDIEIENFVLLGDDSAGGQRRAERDTATTTSAGTN